MLDANQKSAIATAVTSVCEVLRGSSDMLGYRDVVLAMLALKFLADVQDSPQDMGSVNAIAANVVVPPEANFWKLHASCHLPDNGVRMDAALGALASANVALLGGIQELSFSANRLGEQKWRDQLLGQLLQFIAAEPALDFRGGGPEAAAAAAHASEMLLSSVAATMGKRGAEFFTPPALSRLLAALVEPRGGESVMDPCCGSGLLLAACSQFARQTGADEGCALYGQDINGDTLSLARLNMLLHSELSFQFEWGDVLVDPKLRTPAGQLRKFDVVVSSPPFQLAGWQRDMAVRDTLNRFWRGLPPGNSASYAFLSHMVESMDPDRGRLAAVVPLGVLFRGAAEGQIRRKLVEENLVDAVITLPPKLYANTAIPVAVLLLRRHKPHDRVLFVDGSTFFQPGKTQNTLTEADVDRFVSTYRTPEQEQTFARAVPMADIAANDYNLNVTRYVQTIAEETLLDIAALRAERAELQAELLTLEASLASLREGAGNV